MNTDFIFSSEVLLDATMISICLVFSAFFSGSETAISSLGDLKIQHLYETKKGISAKALHFWLESPTLVLSTILVANNIVNISASALATKLMLRLFESNGVAIATGVMTMLVLIFGEITPKSLAKSVAERAVIPVLIIIYGFYFLLYPLVRFFSGLSALILKRLNLQTDGVGRISKKELRYYIRRSSEDGAIHHRKGAMLQALLDFKDTKAQDVMVPRQDLAFVRVGTSVAEAKQIILETGFSRLPVFGENDDSVLGVIHVKDLLRLTENEELKQIIQPPMFVYENKRLEELFEEMQSARSHFAVVLDEYGSTSGVVTLEDLLEEIFGEIRDEYDTEETDEVSKTGKNSWKVDGLMHVEDFESRFRVKLPHDKTNLTYTTIAGFVFSELGRLPQMGDQVRIPHYRISILEMENRRIVSLLLQKTDNFDQT